MKDIKKRGYLNWGTGAGEVDGHQWSGEKGVDP